ncbi:heavy-metal-associated domain-containing protein [Succinimonas sp.]|jgi:hypothetical protein|uniref:heavy-metal-associated domain-containing protein n=1 Tax=Succinimonas sp. TaxID=1936151 RepID=UPI00386D3898
MRCLFRIIGIDCPLCALSLRRSLAALPELRNVIMPFGGTTADIETDLSSEELLRLLSGVSERLHGQVTFLLQDIKMKDR